MTRDNLPPELVHQWVTPDGQARLEVAPSGNANDNATLRKFAHDVQSVEPNATEGPISILEARRTIITAFLQAGALGAAFDRRPVVDHACAGSATCC